MANETKTITLLDIGGEGRYTTAVNLNPSAEKALGPQKGDAIPNRIDGRAECKPLLDSSVRVVVMERTPLRNEAIAEIARVATEDATLVFRNSVDRLSDPHRRVTQRINGKTEIASVNLDGQPMQQFKIQRRES